MGGPSPTGGTDVMSGKRWPWNPTVAEVTSSVSFPPDLRIEQVEMTLGVLAGLPLPARVTSVLEAGDRRLQFALRGRAADLSALEDSLRGFAPGVRFDEEDLDGGPAERGRVAVQ